MSALVSHLDDYAGWLTAVVAGLAALGWLLKRIVSTTRAISKRAREIGRKIDALDELAQLELTHNHGSSMKDQVAKIPQLEARMTAVETALGAQTATTVVVNPAVQESV